MIETSISANDGITLSKRAAEQLFNLEDGDPLPEYEPSNPSEAQAAIRRLGELFDAVPPLIRRSFEGARSGAGLLSSDPFQGLAEIVQNADDVGASQVRLVLRPTDLLVGHDGGGVRLPHVLGLATPWFSTKVGELITTGRFGIGLMTLQSLSETIDVHCDPYHIRLGDPFVSWVDGPLALPMGLDKEGWTTFRIPLDERDVSLEELEEWLDRWDHSALLFLRHVSKLTLHDCTGSRVRELSLSRHGDGKISLDALPSNRTVLRERVEVDDGRSWVVYTENVATPPGVKRARKATGSSTPVAVALPLGSVECGRVYAGLPVAETRLPVFVSAQFDPLANRRDFNENPWNAALVPLVADLWSWAALDLFFLDPQMAWHAMPVGGTAGNDVERSLMRDLECAVVSVARERVASLLSFPVTGMGAVKLSQLAVEAQMLEGILTDAETRSLAELPAVLPPGVRDGDGRWRTVLDGWRDGGADLPAPVSVGRALSLLDDSVQPPQRSIKLVAAGLDEELDERLLQLPCVIAEDGKRIVPPKENSPFAVATLLTPLSQRLSMVTLLHSAHRSDNKDARRVFDWLRECGSLLDVSDDSAVVRRLADVGNSGGGLSTPLTDEQVQAIRDAFGSIGREERENLGLGVGRAIKLEAYEYEVKGRKKHSKVVSARPVDAYLPGRIDREPDSFAVAAGEAPGLVWLSRRYETVLRSPDGRGGLGAQRFLRLLGAETAPRVSTHPGLEQRYKDPRKGLKRVVDGGPPARSQAMLSVSATYTLQDCDSPDLLSVVHSISRERSSKNRRKRAHALLAALARAWGRLSESTEADSAEDNYGWVTKDPIASYWLWQVRDVEWLDDARGKPRRPSELRIRTHGNVAIYGEKSSNYLHGSFYRPNGSFNRANLRDVLVALEVSGDPSCRELLDRLQELRNYSEEGGLTGDELKAETAIVYTALSESLTAGASSRRDVRLVREEFRRPPGLLITELGWRVPEEVFSGQPIFRGLRPFVPTAEGAENLWRAIGLKEPSPDDCLNVIHEITRNRRRAPEHDEEIILLETFRLLSEQHAKGATVKDVRQLAQMRLWTSQGWVSQRPVYSTGDSSLAEGIGERLPVWKPGGDLEQFRNLLDPLKVEEISVANAEVIDSDLAREDPESTFLFQSAVEHLQEDLSRSDAKLAQGLKIPWDRLRGFSVYIHPSLTLRLPVLRKGATEVYDCQVDAMVDVNRDSVFVRDQRSLPRAKGGRALATLFQGDQRLISHAWQDAWNRAEDGQEARPFDLAHQLAERAGERIASRIEMRTPGFLNVSDPVRQVVNTPASDGSGVRNLGVAEAGVVGEPRVLADVNALRLTHQQGYVDEGMSNPLRRPGGGGVSGSSQNYAGPSNNQPIRGYSDLDKEGVGIDLLRAIIREEGREIVDLRAQPGVGADAIDNLGRLYELKVHAGVEPNEVGLTDSEFRRAHGTSDFYLVIISGVEGVAARPVVRVFDDPLRQLQLTVRGHVMLSGVHGAQGRVYNFVPFDDPLPPT